MSLIATRIILAITLCTVLVACSDVADEPRNTPGPATDNAPFVAGAQGGIAEPGAPLTPAPAVVVDMPAARRFEAEGDLDAAVASYVAIAATEKPERVEAALAAGRLFIDQGKFEDAETILTPVRDQQAATSDGTTATYLLGRAYMGLEKYNQAIGQFDAYITAAGPATPYAYLDRSYALVEAERGFEAAESAQTGLNLGVPASMVGTFLLAAAQSYERAGAFADAIGYYNLILGDGASAGDVPLALQRIAALKQLQGDPTYVDERDRLLAEYPASYQALVAMQDADQAGESLDPVVQGLVLYRHNEYTEAEPYFRQQIEAAPNAPESAPAYYYLAAILESRNEIDGALENYAAVDTTDPTSFLADDALWWRARIYEENGDTETAGALYARIVNEYPDSPFADDAELRRGLISYRAGAPLDAAAAWEGDLATTTDSSQRQRLQLWQAKALQEAGRNDAAASVFATLEGEAEDDYFGIRARGVADGQRSQPKATPEASVDLSPQWDWAAAEQWMATYTGLPATNRAWESDPRWQRAVELWRVGRSDFGDDEVYAIIDDYTGDAAALYSLSRELLTDGRIGMSARAGQRLLRALNADPSDGLPKALMSLSYPAAFGPLVQRYAEAEGISPLLLLAFVRQESFFDPRAVSPAGALGLTQVLPETAQTAASELGMTGDVQKEELLHADLNLRLGARFMADQLQRFDNHIFVAITAYNAGPNAAQRWSDTAGDDADLYLETVEFSETRTYLEIVAENYAIYRFIYGGEAEPNLPR